MCELSATGIHPQRRHHANLCQAPTPASSKRLHQKGHSAYLVLHEKETVSPRCAPWQHDGEWPRLVYYPLHRSTICIFKQVIEASGTWLDVMCPADGLISLRVCVRAISADRLHQRVARLSLPAEVDPSLLNDCHR